MAIQGLEWLFIAVIVTILILWDPSKIPKIARAIAEARREYERAVADLQEKIRVEERNPPSSDQRLIEIARELGVQTEGKTKEEIAREILERMGGAELEKRVVE